MTGMSTLLWLRRDLRLTDLPALSDAAADDGEVLACYVLDPRLTASSGPRRLQFLYDSLRELRDALDGRLFVTNGKPETRIPAIAKAVGATAVHISGDHSPFGRRRDDAVRENLGDIPLQATGSAYLVSPGRLTKDDGTPYKVFTPYFRRWQDHGWRSPAKTDATSAQWIDPAAATSAGAGKIWDIPDPGTELSLPAGETAARKRWSTYVNDGLANYADERNRPDLDTTSRMSAYLHFGNIHPRTMATDLGRGDGPQAYLRELAFRDFYATVLAEWPHSSWWNWNDSFDTIRVDDDAQAQQRFETWKAGKTGYPIVDAGMRQLRETGFMHNRVRMITASFLVKDLHLPWQWGARWFLEQLLDGDVASNNHGWQWAAGCGTDAAPYFRVFNPDTQGKKFDPDGEYVRRWVPELGTPDYPDPVVDHKAEREEAMRRYGEIG